MLRDDINNALKDAMKAGDERRVSTLRLVNSTLKNADIEARGQGKPPLSDEDAARRAAEDDQAAPGIGRALREGRPARARRAGAASEIEIISGYLPQQMSDIEAGSIDRRRW